jgi:rubrerythrin
VTGIRSFFHRLGQRTALRSALDLEEEIHGLYESLELELPGVEMPEQLLRILAEEREHKQLLLNILERCISDEEAELALSSGRLHALERVQPLDRQSYGALWEPLERIREREREIRLFFESLCAKTKLPAVRRVLCFIAEQEDVHVHLLDRLLGGESPP